MTGVSPSRPRPSPRFEVSVLGNNGTGFVREKHPGEDLFYNAKYFSNTSQLCIPAQLVKLPPDDANLAISAYKAIDCAMGASTAMNGAQGNFHQRIKSSRIHSHFHVPQALEAPTFHRALVDRLIELAFERKPNATRLNAAIQGP